MKKATFIMNEAAFIRRCGDTNNTSSLRKMQESHIRRSMQISHNQAKVIASLFWGGAYD